MGRIGPLSMDLVVALHVYHIQRANQKAEFSELVESVKPLASKSTVSKNLNTLADWGIVRTEYGPTSSGRAGRLYYISGEVEGLIRELYEQFWSILKKEQGKMR